MTRARFDLIDYLLLAVGLVMALFCGCSAAPKPLHGVTRSNVTLSGSPIFSVTYTVALSEGRTLTVTSSSWPAMEDAQLSFADELEQPNGNSIGFECDHIADKIIDKKLVVEIRPYCVSIHAEATRFWKDQGYRPHRFTDSDGVTWTRAR